MPAERQVPSWKSSQAGNATSLEYPHTDSQTPTFLWAGLEFLCCFRAHRGTGGGRTRRALAAGVTRVTAPVDNQATSSNASHN